MALGVVEDENTTGGNSRSLVGLVAPAGQAIGTSAVPPLDSPLDVALAIFAVLLLAPLIVAGNGLLLAAVSRSKRLHTPSNGFVLAVASADLGIGLYLPFGLYFELAKGNVDCPTLCVLPYCFIITVCSVSLLSVTAISIDRYTSLARPLSYNNIITHQSVNRYVAIFWMYSLLLGSSPVLYVQLTIGYADRPQCAFALIGPAVRLFLFFMLFCPCAVIVIMCYSYVYAIARSHANAIYSVEQSLRQQGTSPCHPRYGRTLAWTAGLFVGLWLPFVVCMLSDALAGTCLLRGWIRIFLALVGLTNSAFNPWVYGYRSSEFRLAFHRTLYELLNKLGLVSKVGLSVPPPDHMDLPSCASHVRLCSLSPNPTARLSITQAMDTDATTLYCETVIDNGFLRPDMTPQPPHETTQDITPNPVNLTNGLTTTG